MSKIEAIINVNTASAIMKADAVYVNGEVFTYKNSGLTRSVFVNESKTLIIKIPIEECFQSHNDNEAELWEEADEETRLQLAETKRLSNGYILQEFLQTLDDSTTEEWLNRPMTNREIRFATSCRNDVGYDSVGNLKCYDYDEFKQY